MELNEFLDKAYSVLRRLDAVLPPEPESTDWNALAFRWQSAGKKGVLEHLPAPHVFPLARLAGVGRQTDLLVRNTEQFIAGRPANNVLMSGARGTGKSSLVKALLHEYADKGLRLIEVDKSDLVSLPYLLTLLKERPEKFIVFCDDLSFESGDENRVRRRFVAALRQRLSLCDLQQTASDTGVLGRECRYNGDAGGNPSERSGRRKSIPIGPFRVVAQFLSVRSKRLSGGSAKLAGRFWRAV